MSKNLQLRLPDREILTEAQFDAYSTALYDGVEDFELPATKVIARALEASGLYTKGKKAEARPAEDVADVAYDLFSAYEVYLTGHMPRDSYLHTIAWKIPGMSDSDSLKSEVNRLANILIQDDALGNNLGTQAIKDIMSLVDNAIKKAKGESIGGR